MPYNLMTPVTFIWLTSTDKIQVTSTNLISDLVSAGKKAAKIGAGQEVSTNIRTLGQIFARWH